MDFMRFMLMICIDLGNIFLRESHFSLVDLVSLVDGSMLML